MKKIKWKTLTISCLVCLLPMLLGLAMWDELPDRVAIHFDINNNPDNFASKTFAVFGLPFIMIAFQVFCCIVTDVSEKHQKDNPKAVFVAKWMIPMIALILQPVTLFYSTGVSLDIRRIAVFIVGAMFILLGNYLPKLDHIKNYNIDPQKARKINRFSGYSMVILGVLFLVSLFFSPVASVICLILLIPYSIITSILFITAGKKK